MEFREPLLLLFLLLAPLLWWRLFRGGRRAAAVRWPDLGRIPASLVRAARWRLALVRGLVLLSWAALVVALAGPQLVHRFEQRFTEGVDIMIALDVSGSMRSVDDPEALARSASRGFYHDLENKLTNRLQHARRLTADFVRKRPDDRLGLVVFAGYAYTRCPLTFDHEMLLASIAGIDFGDVQQQSTAIGMAIANGLQRLVSSTAKSRILILVTDGVNNTGTIDPATAAQMAQALGVRIYTVGIGSDEPLMPTRQPDYYVRSQTVIDEAALKDISVKTGGEYFRAADAAQLASIYDRIDALEKSRIERRVFAEREERYQLSVLLALAALVLSLVLRHLVFRVWPGEAI